MSFLRLGLFDAPPVEKVPYRLIRRRRKSVALRVEDNGTVLVSAPYFASKRWIDQFVENNLAWVERQRRRMSERLHWTAPKRFVSGECFPVWGVPHALNVISSDAPLTEPVQLLDGKLQVCVIPHSSSDNTVLAQEALRLWYPQETKKKISVWLNDYASRLGVTYAHAKVVTQKRRWGSCSREGRLRFNWKLSMLPTETAEYVVVHELAHLREMNHSRDFWAVVASVLPDYKIRRKHLRAFSPHTEFPL